MSILLCGLMLPAISYAATAKEKFTTTTKYVDANGEAFTYSDTRGIEDLINNKIPATIRVFTSDTKDVDMIAEAVIKSSLKLINTKAFQAYAASSIENEKGFYTSKYFILLDKKEKSIFINPTAKNKPLTWQDLPADTRLAFKGECNLAYAWDLFKKEFNKDHVLYQPMKPFLEMPELNEILCNFNGDIEILVTGTSLKNWGFKIVIPDAKGKIAALIKKEFKDKSKFKDNKIEFPVSDELKITVLLQNEQIIAYTNPAFLQPAKKTLRSLPRYQKYAKILPKNGDAYVIVDVPQEAIDILKDMFDGNTAICKLVDIYLRPFSFVSAETVEKDGVLVTVASDFSFAQLNQSMGSTAAFLPVTAAMLLPALNSARTKARTINCVNNLKQLGLAVIMYSGDHNDFLPSDMKEIVKQAYIKPQVLENLIYVGPYEKTKISSIKNPSKYVIAVCNRTNHVNSLNVLFADGHVESFPNVTGSTEDFLKQKLNLDQAAYNRIAKRLSEAQK